MTGRQADRRSPATKSFDETREERGENTKFLISRLIDSSTIHTITAVFSRFVVV